MTTFLNRIVLTFVVLLCVVIPVRAADLSGRAIAIADGDTFTLLTESNEKIKIRLAEIDAPESGQPYGNKSKQILSELIFGKDIRVVIQTTDRYGRTVGRPYLGNLDICTEMVRMGVAWVYREYLIDEALLEVEKEAKAHKRGLWVLSEAKNMPPWEWRRNGDQEGATEGCNIKGNINSKGVRIYHVPGRSGYGVTQINESKGERWFCSEEEALSARWRAARN